MDDGVLMRRICTLCVIHKLRHQSGPRPVGGGGVIFPLVKKKRLLSPVTSFFLSTSFFHFLPPTFPSTHPKHMNLVYPFMC